MKSIILAGCIALLIASTAQAQVFKCNDQGKIVYSDKPCEFQARTVHLDSTSFGNETGKASGNSNSRMLAGHFNQAMADRDYDKAERLAVTSEQKQAVIDARKDVQVASDAAKAEKKANARRRMQEKADRDSQTVTDNALRSLHGGDKMTCKKNGLNDTLDCTPN